MTQVWCRVRGHRWNLRSLACSRCHQTQEEIVVGARPDPTHEDVAAAYWRGIEDGRRLDRKRAYRLGLRRMHRDIMAILEGGQRVRRATAEDISPNPPANQHTERSARLQKP